MVGFTDLSETLEPEELSEVLNGYLRQIIAAVVGHGGTLDRKGCAGSEEPQVRRGARGETRTPTASRPPDPKVARVTHEMRFYVSSCVVWCPPVPACVVLS